MARKLKVTGFGKSPEAQQQIPIQRESANFERLRVVDMVALSIPVVEKDGNDDDEVVTPPTRRSLVGGRYLRLGRRGPIFLNGVYTSEAEMEDIKSRYEIL